MKPTQEPQDALDARRRAVDRAQWEGLREAAGLGRLQPEGAELLERLHEDYPAWREEF